MSNRLIFLLVFFTFSGFYIGIALLLSFGQGDITRYYSIPFRIIISIGYIYIIIKNIKTIKNKNIFIYFLLFTIFSIIYMIKIIYTSEYYEIHLKIEEYIFYYISFCYLPAITFALINVRINYNEILKGILYSSSILGIFIVYLYADTVFAPSIEDRSLRISSDEFNKLPPLIVSYYSAVTLSVLLSLSITYNKWIKINRILCIVSLVTALIMFSISASRGPVLGLGLLLILLLLKQGILKKQTIYLVSIILLISLVFSSYFSDIIILRFTGMTSQGSFDPDQELRVLLWIEAIREFLANPIIGGRIEMGAYYPHNIFIETLMATGLLGLFFLFIPIVVAIKSLKNLIHYNANYYWVLGLLLIAISQAMFTNALYNSILFFSVLGITINVNNFKINKQ